MDTLIEKEFNHGTLGKYRQGCTCKPCLGAKRKNDRRSGRKDMRGNRHPGNGHPGFKVSGLVAACFDSAPSPEEGLRLAVNMVRNGTWSEFPKKWIVENPANYPSSDWHRLEGAKEAARIKRGIFHK